MSVRLSLLAILEQGPCYGYQLRAEFDRRTGAIWPLNVGQIYNTLDRLERDGLVAKGETDANGHVYYTSTPAGSRAVAEWIAAPLERTGTARDELAVKIAVATTLPGVDAAAMIAAERAASLADRERLIAAPYPGATEDGPEEHAWALVVDAMVAHKDAEIAWLDRAADRVAQHPGPSMALDLSPDRPRRGRPARSEADAPRRPGGRAPSANSQGAERAGS